MQEKNSYYRETVNGILFAIAMQLAAENEESGSEINESIHTIAPALIYIDRSYREEISIRELAKRCRLSESHFRRVFHEDMNITPAEYIHLVRVQTACGLMRNGNDTMQVVAQKVGYKTFSTFNRNFRKITGMSPYQWKKKADKESRNIGDYRIRAKKGW